MTYQCDHAYDDEESGTVCPHCDGLRSVECYYCGDFCCCDNGGDKDCPYCQGEGEVSEERYQAYLERQRQRAIAWADAAKKSEGSTDA